MSEVQFTELPFEKFVLPNGLTVILRQDRSVPVVSLQAWVETGSIHEGSFLGSGLSHFVEHMLFKGTEQRYSDDIAREVSSMGGQINAYTSFDRTVYYIDGPAEGAISCLDVLMDVVCNATLPEDEFHSEQEVIRREFSMGKDDPEKVASQEMFATCFHVHPYGVPVIGHLENFNQIDRSNVYSYYRERYAPNNMFLVGVGDFDPAEMRERIENFSSDYLRRSVAPVFIPDEPIQVGRRDKYVNFSTPVSKLWMAWKIPSITHPDMAALDVLAVILGQGRSSRLHKTLRDEKGLVHRIGAFSYTPASAGLFAVGANLDAANKEAAESAIFDELKQLKDNGVKETELDKARRIALVSQIESLVTVQGQASDLGSNWSVTRNLSFTKEYLRRVSSVELNDISVVARKYLDDSSLNVVEVGPECSPKAPNVFTGKSFSNIKNFEMGNGLRVIVEEDSRLPLVSVSAAFRAGIVADHLAKQGTTELLSRTLLQGTNNRSSEQIADIIESTGGSIYAGGGFNCLYANLEVLNQEITIAMEVLSDVLVAPSFPVQAVEREKKSQMAAIDQELDSPLGMANIAARNMLFRDHPYCNMRLGDKKIVSSITEKELAEFHSKYAVSENSVISVCGSIEENAIRDQIEELFSSMQNGEEYFSTVPDPGWPASKEERTEYNDKEQAIVVLAFPGISLYSPDRASLILIEEICGGMDGTLFKRIREDMGLAYFVGVSQMIGFARGMIMFYVGTREDVVDQVHHELMKEIRKIFSDGITEEQLERAKMSYAGKYSLGKQSHIARSQSRALNVLYGLGIDYDVCLLDEMKSLKSNRVIEVAKKYFDQEAFVSVNILPSRD